MVTDFLESWAKPNPKTIEIFLGDEVAGVCSVSVPSGSMRCESRRGEWFVEFDGEEKVEVSRAEGAEGFERILAGCLHIVALEGIAELGNGDLKTAAEDILFKKNALCFVPLLGIGHNYKRFALCTFNSHLFAIAFYGQTEF